MARIACCVLLTSLLLLPAASGRAAEWVRVLGTGEPAPGEPGRSVVRVGGNDPGGLERRWTFDEAGTLHFLAWVDGAPDGGTAGRLLAWSAQDGTRTAGSRDPGCRSDLRVERLPVRVERHR